MLKRRVPRVLASGFLLAVTVSGLTACRTSPDVAAYVGEAQVTVTELDAAIADRKSDPDIAAYAGQDEAAFTRQVLSLLVEQEVHAAAAQRYDVRVTDDDVRARIDELLGDEDADAVFDQLAQLQGVGRQDIIESVRQELVRQRVAEGEGEVEPVTETALRALYDEARVGLAEYSFGYIGVPDAATGQSVLDQLTAAPDSYAALAAQFPGPLTVTALETRAPADLPEPLAAGITAAAPNTGFTVPGPTAGQVVVGFVADIVYPPFEELRPGLQRQASEATDQVGAELVSAVRDDLGVTVNTRFGVLEEGRVVPAEGGVDDILEGDGLGGDDAVPAAE